MIRVVVDAAADAWVALAVDRENARGVSWRSAPARDAWCLGNGEEMRPVGGCRLGRFRPLKPFMATTA